MNRVLFNSINHSAYFIHKLLSSRLIAALLLSYVIVIIFLTGIDLNTGEIYVKFVSAAQSSILINGLSGFVLPVYFFLFLFIVAEFTSFSNSPNNIKTLLARGSSRFYQLASVLIVVCLLSLLMTLLIAIPALKYLEINSTLQFLTYVFIGHLIIFSQVCFLISLKFTSASILVIYFLFFIIFPALFGEILKASLIISENTLLLHLSTLIEHIFMTHLKLFQDIGSIISGTTTHLNKSVIYYTAYILLFFLLFSAIFIKRDFTD